MAKQSFREQSRQDWTPIQAPIKTEQLTVGCLQRIADATEKMAVNINSLISENIRLKGEVNRQSNIIRGLRGEITKLKK